MNQEHFNLTYTFATTIGGFFNRDGVPIFMNRWKDDSRIHNSFFVYGEDKNQYFLGEIIFQAGALNFKSFIDGEVIHFLRIRNGFDGQTGLFPPVRIDFSLGGCYKWSEFLKHIDLKKRP